MHDAEGRPQECHVPMGPPPDYRTSVSSPRHGVESLSAFTLPMSDDPEIRFRRDRWEHPTQTPPTGRQTPWRQERSMGAHSVDGFSHRPVQDGRWTPRAFGLHDDERHVNMPRMRQDQTEAIHRRATSAPPYRGYTPHPGVLDNAHQQFQPIHGDARSHQGPLGPAELHTYEESRDAARHGGGSQTQLKEVAQHWQHPTGGLRRAPSLDRLYWASERQEQPPRGYRPPRARDMPPVFESHSEPRNDRFPRPYAIFGRQGYMGEQNGQGSDPQYHGRPMPRQTRYDQPAPMGGVQQVQQVNKVKRPATYDGKSSWEDYLVQFQMIAEINNWDSRTQALELATSLRGQAMGVLTDLDPEQRESYGSLVAALSARFEPSNTAEIFRAKLKGRVRGKTETLTELAHHIRHLTRKAYPSVGMQVREHLALESFIEALNDGELEWFVFQTKPQSIDQAVETALEYEAFKQGRRRRVGDRHYVRMQQDEAPMYSQPQNGNSGHGNWQGGVSQMAGSGVQSSRLSHIRDAPCDIGTTDSQVYADQYGQMTTEENLQTVSEEPYLCASCEDGRVARMSNNSNFNQSGGRPNGQNQRSQGCFNCGDMGHYRRECPKGVICNNCGQPGHVRRDCVGCNSSNSTGNETSQKDGSDKTALQGNARQLGQRAMPQH